MGSEARTGSGAAGEIAEGRPPRRRLSQVDRVTGFAILLVVIGHVVARDAPSDNAWYAHLKFGIYQFHMPLFMAMSGLVFRYTYTPVSTAAAYLEWASSKIIRLAPGFLLVGLLILLGKSLFAGFLYIDNVQDDFLGNLTNLFIRPTQSAASSLWYIYVLLEFYLLFPILIAACRGNEWVVLSVTAVMHAAWIQFFPELPRIGALEAQCEFAVYFWIGAMICPRYDAVLAGTRRHALPLGLLFAASFGVLLVLPWPLHKTLIGVASIPAALAIIGPATGRVGRWFAVLSGYTFVIYLLNTIVIGVVKGVMLKAISWDGPAFLLFFVVLTVAGLGVPILAHRWFFSRSRLLARVLN